MQHLKELFNSLALPIVITGPGAISTDCDQALRNGLNRVFPDSPTLLCSWHANKNIQQHCRSYFTTEETWERFIQGWNSIVSSKTEEEYHSRHTQFQNNFASHPACIQYINQTWLRTSRKEALVQAWTNKYPHFGITVTSRLVSLALLRTLTNYSRVESSHSFLKRYIPHSQGDLYDTWLAIEMAIAKQMRTIQQNDARNRIRTPLELDERTFGACFGTITTPALREVRRHNISLKRPLEPCTGVFTRTLGLPCAHVIDQRKTLGLGLVPDDFHPHWFWTRNSLVLQPPILEPLQIISRGAPRKSLKTSTKRIPSGFEATERPKERRCGLCNLPGHDRRSISCIVRLRQDGQELGFDPQILPVQQPTLRGPSSDTIIVCESRTNNMSDSTRTEAIPTPIEPLVSALPRIEVETRPVWPGRIEVIYAKYIAEKMAFLASNPTVQESNYRKCRGLKVWTPLDRRYQMRFLPRQRVDIKVKKLIDGRPRWTNEEVDAYLDYQALREQEIEAEEEARLVAQGGFGRSKGRGIGGLLGQINRRIEEEEAQYCFVIS